MYVLVCVGWSDALTQVSSSKLRIVWLATVASAVGLRWSYLAGFGGDNQRGTSVAQAIANRNKPAENHGSALVESTSNRAAHCNMHTYIMCFVWPPPVFSRHESITPNVFVLGLLHNLHVTTTTTTTHSLESTPQSMPFSSFSALGTTPNRNSARIYLG